jgi:catechol 2,3-dioxygenase-like lactoylglutathione lyase family enzyme
MIRGINHVTLAVTDLDRALRFYEGVLGIRCAARWPQGAYLEAGALWLCLSVDANARQRPHPDYTHVALDIAAEDFDVVAARILAAGAPTWKDNRSEGPSLYFLDPDGHKLELHVGTLRTRLAGYRAKRPPGMILGDDE